MTRPSRLARFVAILAGVLILTAVGSAQPGATTRVSDPKEIGREGTESYPFRKKVDYIMKELDLHAGDVALDVGAGDGWWSAHMAQAVGETGKVHASEVSKRKVAEMKKKLAKLTNVRPYVCKADSTGLPANSCDLAFFAQVYHHLNLNGHVPYLKHLHEVIRPTGRLCIIERYPQISTRHLSHGTPLSRLVKQAEEAGWVPVRYELMPRTYHYLVLFVQRSTFPAEPEPKKARSRERDRGKSR